MTDSEDSPTLAPYRIQVQLVENRRVEGRIKQEHVAQLGSIEGHLLPAFFEGVSTEIAGAMKSPGWERASIRARAAFWKGCNAKMKQLSNRIGPELKALRMAIHGRIPWPMDPERKRLELLDAEADEQLFRSLHGQTTAMVEANKRIIERATTDKARLEREARLEAEQALAAARKVASLRKAKPDT